MTLTASDVLTVVILFSCVPLQYVIVQYWGNVASTRSYALHRILSYATNFYKNYLNPKAWEQWFGQLLNPKKLGPSYIPEDEGESPALEVLQYKQKDGYFGMSSDPRTERSPDILYHIGQVVVHKRWKYKGVIIGWDKEARAPPDWLDEMHKENEMWKYMPNYSILVDTRDRLTPQITYVPQDNIEVVKTSQIFHPLLENYFERFEDGKYIPRPWLQTVYPQD